MSFARTNPVLASGLVSAVLLGFLAGCGPRGVRTDLSQGPDRTGRPGLGPVPALTLPPVERFTLSNGLPVLFVRKPDIPLIQVDLLVRAGGAHDPEDRVGLASLTSAMLREGADGRSSLELADALEQLGARLETSADDHFTTVALRVPTARIEPALALMAAVTTRPDFAADELERVRVERLTALLRQHDEPHAVANLLLIRTLYGGQHPYGRQRTGDESSLRLLSAEDLRRFHAGHYRPEHSTLLVVGDVGAEDARRELERAFGRWQPAPSPELHAPDIPETGQVRGRQIYLVDHPGAAQSVIRIGRIGAPRLGQEYYALQVLNTVLGGSFTSRLNRNLREDKGYTYGAASSFDYRPAAGPFTAHTDVQTDVTGPALAEFIHELRAIRDSIAPEELALARNFLAMRFPAGFQTVEGIAGRLSELVRHDLPDDYLDEYTDRILAVTDEEVGWAARRYINAANVVIVVVGDRAAIEEQVRAQHLGPITFLEFRDVLGPPPALAGEVP